MTSWTGKIKATEYSKRQAYGEAYGKAPKKVFFFSE